MPIVAPLNTVVPQFFNKFSRTQVGKKTKILIWPGGFNLGKSYNPLHTFNMQGSGFRSDLIGQPFAGGKQVKNINVVTNTGLATKTLTFKVNGKTVKTLTFIPTDASADQINIGTNEAGTKANILAKLNGLKLTKKTRLLAEDASGLVKVTGSAFENLSITSSDIANVTVVDGTDVAATLPIVFAGDIFVENTIAIFRIGLYTTDALGNESGDRITIATLTPAGITSKAELINAIKAVFIHALAGSAPADSEGNVLGYIYSENQRMYAEIKAALIDVFGSSIDNCFTVNTDSTGFTLKTVQPAYLGLAGNGLQCDFALFASEPDGDISIDKNFTVTIAGVAGKPAGSTLSYESNSEVSTADVPQDSEDLDYGKGKTGIKQTVKFGVNDVHSAEISGLIAASSRSINITHDISMPGGGNLPVIGVCALIDTDIAGQKHIELANIYVTDSNNFKGSKASVDPLLIGGSVIPVSGVANPGLVKLTFRQAGQA